ncbi:MAG TPA: DUF2065 domain-containing protein [Xanthomonadales bacterium]|nr:DUF2065 domain-containing protein [Xanthomonadales bacterium]
MLQDLLTAIALLLIIEGLMPVIAPLAWQKYLLEISRMNPRTIRMAGIASMLIGAFLLQFMH